MSKILTVAIIGCGSRGCFVYGNTMFAQKDKFKIVALCDGDADKLRRYRAAYGIDEKNVFLSEVEFFKCRRADVIVIATQDRDHVRMCLSALKLGYDVLLEKPISPLKRELRELLNAQKKYGGKVVVCHVLRYAPSFMKVKEILNDGSLGRLVCMETIEHATYWHHAHGFVRGNWRREEDTSPMIMQKCCHDLDLICFYADANCDSVYSIGDLSFFTRENMPYGAAERCYDCKYLSSCAYSAENIYIKRWKQAGSPENAWPYNVCCTDIPTTEDKLRAAIVKSEYGRCVFACDNDVVDNQKVEMLFENGVKVSHTMTGFTAQSGRRMVFHCTYGEMIFDESEDKLSVFKYGGDKEEYIISQIGFQDVSTFGHGGGDAALIDDFYDVVAFGKEPKTSLSASVESHLIAIASEESRKSGRVIKVHDGFGG